MWAKVNLQDHYSDGFSGSDRNWLKDHCGEEEGERANVSLELMALPSFFHPSITTQITEKGL